MTGRTHAAVAVSAALTIIMTKSTPVYETLSSVIIGAMSLDIDCQKSTIGQMFPIIAKPVDRNTKHRGIVHWGLPVLFLSLWIYFRYDFLIFLFAGSCTHLAIDLITHELKIFCNSRGEDRLYKVTWGVNFALILTIVCPDWYRVVIGIVIDLLTMVKD